VSKVTLISRKIHWIKGYVEDVFDINGELSHGEYTLYRWKYILRRIRKLINR